MTPPRLPRDRRDRRDRNGEDFFDPDAVRVKTEPEDDYPEYNTAASGQNPALKDEDKKPRDLVQPPPPPPPPEGENGAYERRDEGEIDY